MQSIAVGTDQSDLVIGAPIVVTNEEHRFLALEQLRELGTIGASLLLEPIGRNTAPAVTLAALQSMLVNQDDPILVVTPADQTVTNEAAFTAAIQKCISVVKNDLNGKTIAILGVEPDRAEVGYGYIRRSNDQDEFSSC